MNAPWAPHYDPDVPLEVGPVTDVVPSLLTRAAANSPQAKALVFLGRYLTYRELEDQTSRLAQALQNQGLAAGQRLAILLPNCPQLVMAYQAALRLGAVAVFLNPLLTPKELAFQITNSGARHLVVLDHLLPKVEAVEQQGGMTHLVITRLSDYLPLALKCLYPLKARHQGLALGFKPGPGRLSWRQALKNPPLKPSVLSGPQDPAVLQFTGGTTGVPKAAMLTHGNLMANVVQLNAWMPQARYGAERVMGLLPFCHSFGLTACLNWPMSLGGMIIVLPRFELEMFHKAMKKHRPTVLPGVPTLFVALINDPRLPGLDLSELWLCVSGSAALPQEVRDRFEGISGCRILEGYGLTEASPVTHFNPIQGQRPPGSMGMPIPGTRAKVMDPETGVRELPPGEVGELVLQGPQVMQEYWENPEETKIALRDGWLYTGDLARMDESGYFYIVERKKDMIISGGYNIYPREVEEVLYQHPQVKEAVAFGIPDPYRGEVVKAVIVPQDGRPPAVDDIQEHCRRELAPYKVPKMVEFRSELPKSLVGKVLRRVLKEESLKAAGPRLSEL
ncbi:MAG: long-chain fatty acid--CoA ligase [Deltaproteobacteria bacterium]|nr:long-chain fatty acid--CoA ligase [Deltaproteobacteria bacterium]